MLVVAFTAIAFAVSGCGSSSDGASEVAKQQELRAARAEAAQNARQSARIADLEKRLKHASRRQEGSQTRPPRSEVEVPAGDTSTAAPPEEEMSLEGLWKGEAVINYDSGESDPFQQTIQLESLRPGEVSGYSEAVQGSTTCHGAITFEDVSEGWSRFSAEEQNKAECIDSSEVDLMPVSADTVEYRETTEVSLSTGTLHRVR